MSPKQEWLKILRDLMLIVVGTFMLVYETLEVRPPSLDVLSVGAALLGIPMVVRLDLWANRNGNGNGTSSSPPPAQERRRQDRRRSQ